MILFYLNSFTKSFVIDDYLLFTSIKNPSARFQKSKIKDQTPIITLVTDLLYEEERERLEEIELMYGFKSIVKADKSFHQEYYDIVQV